MFGGYAGKILYVDLTKGTLKEERPAEKTYRDYIGGHGLGVKVLFGKMRPGVDPLGPDNMLGFVTGPLTATSVPGTGRHMIVTKSPLTGTWAEANSGGTFGPRLKQAGYDAIFFSGAASKPVYLLIRDGKAEIKDASRLWGKDTYDTDDLLHEELGEEAVAACIGQSGESKSLIAGIVNEKGRIAARMGVGAVMGSKNLKAVVLLGKSTNILTGNPDKLKVARQAFSESIKNCRFDQGLTALGTGGGVSNMVKSGDSPLKNWQLEGLDAMPTCKNLDSPNMEKFKLDSYGCQACPIRCGALIQVKEGPFATKTEMHRPEYESLAALGTNLMNDNLESVIKANDLLNRYGMDTISAGGTIALAMECYERGMITVKDTGGLDLRWGSPEAIVTLVEKMGKREGFGAVLADGAQKAAERIGKGAEQYAMAVRGQSPAYHDGRMSPVKGTFYFADAVPAHHMDTNQSATLENGGSIGPAPEYQVPKLAVFGDYNQKGPLYAIGAEFYQVFSSAGLCSLYTIGNPIPLAELIAGVTGWDYTYKEMLETGRRILTLRQAFNVREGISPDKMELPKRMLGPKTVGPAKGVTVDFESLRAGYYNAMGWDLRSGKPYRKTLVDLGLDDMAKNLWLEQAWEQF
jgi:aldehyde:ferredoxin oxidoreductase